MESQQLFTEAELRRMARAARFLSIDAVQQAGCGHPGMPLGAADIMTALFSSIIRVDPEDGGWMNRDRFVLSAGHGSALLYSVFHLMGYADFPVEQVRNFRQHRATTAGHPEYGHARGVDATTGPLGQGIAMAAGMAMAEEILRARFGNGLVDHFTYALLGDGCLMEGVSQEALELAGHYRLGRLIALFDDNGVTIDGKTSLATSVDLRKRVEGCGWEYFAVDGHDALAIVEAIEKAKRSPTPSLIACKTTIGLGALEKEGSPACHGAPLGEELIARMRVEQDWPHPAFAVPDDIAGLWRRAAQRAAKTRGAWDKAFAALSDGERKAWDEYFAFDAGRYRDAFDGVKKAFSEKKAVAAARISSHGVLETIAKAVPSLIGGSADLSPACGSKATGIPVVTPDDKSGSYIHYGVREHGMAAAMNGISLHGGLRPFGSTFFCFSDYSKPAIRLAALMAIPAIHIFSHDSISVGEDGPTHQPIEHLAMLRAMPNCRVMRPGDAVETVECWQVALETGDRPTALVLSRLPLEPQREYTPENLCRRGAYVLKDATSRRAATLMATGSEVQLAVKVKAQLADRGIDIAVVSMPCWDLFDAQPEAYRKGVLGGCPVFAVEAAASFGWERYTGCRSRVFGIDRFGLSASPAKVYAEVGLTAERIGESIASALR